MEVKTPVLSRLFLTAFIFLWCPLLSYAVLIDGYCYLENQTNHEGIQISFMTDTPEAAVVLAFTDDKGYYRLEIAPGVYFIRYSKVKYEELKMQLQGCSQSQTIPYFVLHRDFCYDLKLQASDNTHDHFACGKGQFEASRSVTIEYVELLPPEGEVKIYLVSDGEELVLQTGFQVEINANGENFAVYRIGQDASSELVFYWSAQWDEEDE